MAGTTASRSGAATAVRSLVARYDATTLDLPHGPRRVRLQTPAGSGWDAVLDARGARLEDPSGRPHAALVADAATWGRLAADVREAGLDAFRSGQLRIRHDLHLGVGFLAATSGIDGPERMRLRHVETRAGALSVLEAGQGPPLVMVHGLGGTKMSFLPTIQALAHRRRAIAIDLPGFGDSDKPIGRYDPPFFARRVLAGLDELGLGSTSLLGHSLGGRVALEVGFEAPDRFRDVVLITPSLAWLRNRRWAPLLRAVRPELGLIQPAPRIITEALVRRIVPGANREGWVASAVDEFLRAFLTARGRAAFYAAARNIYLEDPARFWPRLEELAPRSMFVWGRRDPLVPAGFRRHVEQRIPTAEHVELDCGHVPQLERPRELHAAIAGFLERGEAGRNGGRSRQPAIRLP